MINIRNLLIQRDGRNVLQIDALDIKRGETLAVVGPNGAGKSTLLLALANLIRPTSGEIIFGGRALTSWVELEYRRKISFVFQDPLLMDMSVEKNATLGLRFRGLKSAEAHDRASVWLARLGVESLARRRASQLSGGEAHRVALARALVLDPELLLMDEPFSALDSPTRMGLIKDLSKLLKEDQRTTVFVTHNLAEAAKLGQRIAVIIHGRLRQVGPARQIKANPVDKAVAAFLRELQD